MKGIVYAVLYLMLISPVRCQEFNAFQWLAGTWEMPKPNGSFRLEVWESNGPNALSGKGMKVIAGDTTYLESIRLYLDEKDVWYTPTVTDQNGGQPVPFKLVSVVDHQYIFENPAHDFPQRIIYEFKPLHQEKPFVSSPGDTLEVSVTSMDVEGIDFRLTRK